MSAAGPFTKTVPDEWARLIAINLTGALHMHHAVLPGMAERKAGRIMTERDYTAWLAVRVIGEAVTRTGSDSPQTLRDYILSPKFEVAGFKGQGMNFRLWDLQLRQPILIAGPRALVSISPQEGFLHPKYLTDTLGFDEPETRCRLSNRASRGNE
jgi:ABC transporter substrate binding protein (PQQ-dependent alcohol dehydrogenase system)